MACTMASIPVAAVTGPGSPRVKSGSRTAMSGNRTGDTTPRFSSSPTVMIEIGVTSEPVPAVVGIRISGKRGPLAFPMPQAPSKSSLLPARSATSLATSRDEPPPKPIMEVARCRFAASTASSTSARGGSAATFSNRPRSRPVLTIARSQGLCRPRDRIPGSVTRKGRSPRYSAAWSVSRSADPFSKTMRWLVLKVNAPIIVSLI